MKPCCNRQEQNLGKKMVQLKQNKLAIKLPKFKLYVLGFKEKNKHELY